ncbi:hypothetical protein WR25_26198 isoform C [Diploscapter pachys]|nr:hypothetical protein WR25_26198 isoform C [Diploscapter pachys]
MRVTRSIMTLVAQLFQNITDFAPDPNEMHPLLPVVLSGLRTNDRDARGEALRACAQMCEWSVVWRMMYEEDILAQLVLLLDQRKDLVELFYILKVIDTITQNTSMYSIYLIRFGLFRFLSCLLPIPVVGQDVCFILSNLVAEGQRLIDMIFDTGFIPQLAAVLENADCETRKEASHALCRCICFTRNSEHLRVIVDLHILQQLADLLTVMDAQLISQILDAIQCLLAYGAEHLDKCKCFSPFSFYARFLDGLNLVAEELDALGVYTKLEFLTDSNVVDIHIKAFEIIEVYFPSRLETMDEHVPAYGGDDNFSAPKTTVDDTIESILNCVNK